MPPSESATTPASASFDAFYVAARDQLLVQCYALTGDLAASRRAVRDAFVVGWHHWRKLDRRAAAVVAAPGSSGASVASGDDAGSAAYAGAGRSAAWARHVEEGVRPHAWRLAQRRHTARLWHRDRDVDPEVRATLDALAKLTTPQRQALVLMRFASVTMAQLARELDLPTDRASAELQSGVAQLALARGVSSVEVPALLSALAASVAGDPVRSEVDGDAGAPQADGPGDPGDPVDPASAVALAAAVAAASAAAREGSGEPAGSPARSPGSRVRWPQASVIRRAGTGRRRLHTTLGAAGAVALLLGSGAVIDDHDGVHPTLARVADRTSPHRPVAPVVAPTLTTAHLLSADQVSTEARASRGQLPAGPWSVTTDSAGDGAGDGAGDAGPALPCQQRPSADPHGTATLVRRLQPAAASGRSSGGRSGAVVVQVAEASATTRAARATYDTMVGWLAGCTTGETQLLATRTPQDVGDEAVQFSLRSWAHPTTVDVVGVARTGVYTTTTLTERSGAAADSARGRDPQSDADLLATAVGALCSLPEGGTCADTSPTLVARDPIPEGSPPGLLLTADLPPVLLREDRALKHRWTGSPPAAPAGSGNLAATTCDRTSFTATVPGATAAGSGSGTGARHAQHAGHATAGSGTPATFSHVTARTFLVEGARSAGLPATFGIVETAGVLPSPAAADFVAGVRSRVGGCAKKYLGSVVTPLGQHVSRDGGVPATVTAWRITVAVSAKERATYVMGVLRRGTAVAQVTFLPGGGADLPDADFLALARRALQRLADLPRPS